MPRSGAVGGGVLSGRTSRSRDGSAESATITQRTPGGTDPTGTPVVASLMNNSPLLGPPMDAFAVLTAMAIRSSRSTVAVTGRAAIPGQPTASQSATLTPTRVTQRPTELV